MTDAGQIINMCRRSVKWSMMKLSVESSVSQSTILEIEHGRRGCRVETFEKLLDAMGYEMEILKKDE